MTTKFLCLTNYTNLRIVYSWRYSMNPIPAFLQLECTRHCDDDRIEDDVLIEVHGVPQSRVSRTVVSHAWSNPQATRPVQNGLFLPDDLARRLLVAPWPRLRHEMFAADGNEIEWELPDVRPWLARWFYQQQASVVARAM